MTPEEFEELVVCRTVDEEVELIERLILAERERVAKVAEHLSGKHPKSGWATAMAIRDAIRSGEEPTDAD